MRYTTALDFRRALETRLVARSRETGVPLGWLRKQVAFDRGHYRSAVKVGIADISRAGKEPQAIPDGSLFCVTTVREASF